ncbi:hypothetical protein CCYN2B_120032 [Capnocytophaga cynodegmi]|uniref:Uncharacterized protein n=1 Tax=Capnocytophaga cynodegmi TaxID=28189 RepID=A0A0B7H002_9FLAO|nr:hypothetical protein CCYN2B_120032 [Capnocytophaga cynodegmi]
MYNFRNKKTILFGVYFRNKKISFSIKKIILKPILNFAYILV